MINLRKIAYCNIDCYELIPNDLLSLSEVFLESVWEPLWVLDKLPLALLERLLARYAWDVGGDVVDSVQQLLDGTGYVPANLNNQDL